MWSVNHSARGTGAVGAAAGGAQGERGDLQLEDSLLLEVAVEASRGREAMVLTCGLRLALPQRAERLAKCHQCHRGFLPQGHSNFAHRCLRRNCPHDHLFFLLCSLGSGINPPPGASSITIPGLGPDWDALNPRGRKSNPRDWISIPRD